MARSSANCNIAPAGFTGLYGRAAGETARKTRQTSLFVPRKRCQAYGSRTVMLCILLLAGAPSG
jgi:hypothetical protein